MSEAMAVKVQWPDGSTNQGTPKEILEQVRAVQWSAHTPLGFRLQLAKRARAWSNQHVSVFGSARVFIQRLAKAGMLKIEEN